MNDPKKPDPPPPVPEHSLPGAADGADHVETFREGEVQTPADAPPPPDRVKPRE